MTLSEQFWESKDYHASDTVGTVLGKQTTTHVTLSEQFRESKDYHASDTVGTVLGKQTTTQVTLSEQFQNLNRTNVKTETKWIHLAHIYMTT